MPLLANHRARVLFSFVLAWSILDCSLAQAQTSAPAQPAAAPHMQWSLTNTTRVESWSFFDPPSTGGDPDYTFVANRLRIGVDRTWSVVDVNASLQYVQFGGLPTDASGPGALGTGALYFGHSDRIDSRGVYLRTLFARVRLPGGVVLQGGRVPYQSGAESASGQPKIEAVKRARLDSRLIGEFEWSLYQRTFDGVRADLDRRRWHLTGAWLLPTQGGFEEDAVARMAGINLGLASMTLRPSALVPATDVNVFAVSYHDDRPVAARPDNSGLTAQRVDVDVITLGTSLVGAASRGPGEADWLAWVAAQTGTWYSQSHRAWSLALEGGYQWKARWQPWLRGGFLQASGDHDAADDRHGTFFPVLPTVRKYAFTAVYAPMNLRDVFVEASLRPVSRATVRADVRRLWLADAADLWYAGSGASQQRGTIFGYAGRQSGGATAFGTVLEGAANVTLGRHWSINGFAGTIRGGPVVRTLFVGRWLRFFYIENVLQY